MAGECQGTVLVVDDDEDTRDVTVEVLESAGYHAIGLASGREAFALLRGGAVQPCVILLDMMMPGMDGWAFRAEQLRDGRLATIPVVVFSAFGDAQRAARQLGAADVVEKPVDIDRLLGVVRAHC